MQYSSELTAADCFELGRQSYNNEDYYHTLLWMREADDRLGRELNQTVDRSDILEYLAFSTYKQGTFLIMLDRLLCVNGCIFLVRWYDFCNFLNFAV